MIAPDSSVLIAALAPWHVAHDAARSALVAADRRLIAHVAFECVSALSRMPRGHRISPDVVLRALQNDFPPAWLSLDAVGMHEALTGAVAGGVRGGALYDALVGATAREHGVRLISADRRASRAYQAMDVDVTYVSST